MRATAVFLIVCLLAIAAPGCDKGKENFAAVGNKIGRADSEKHPAAQLESLGTTEPARTATAPATTTPDRTATPAPEVFTKEIAPLPEVKGKTPELKPAESDAIVGHEKPVARMPKKVELPSGVLTAGSFDDNVDPLVFNRFVKRIGQRRDLGDLLTKMNGQRLLVIVKDSAGKPLGNARVALSAGTGTPVEFVTRSDGRAVFMLSLDQLPADQALKATVTPPFGGASISETITAGAGRWDITVPATQAHLPKNLDLCIVLDTTGSMADELRHLKAEIRGVSTAIAKQFPEVKQRISLVLYRDEEDDYVVRPFDFTDSLDVFHKRLADQTTAGGGDYPEAMHKGLEEALQLRWNRDADTARIMFLIADAPPHAQHMNRTLAAADALRKKGVTIYPIACSGYDEACEFVMRSCALITGGQFMFLTDDSGVGGGHAEPSIPYYQVERQEKLMVRLIASELTGQHIQPNPADIIRVVGKKVN